MAHDTVIMLGFFFGVFALIALWEVLAPRRALTTSKAGRWIMVILSVIDA